MISSLPTVKAAAITLPRLATGLVSHSLLGSDQADQVLSGHPVNSTSLHPPSVLAGSTWAQSIVAAPLL
jgi:hypothetical protein